MGVPPVIIHFSRIFHEINHPFRGTAMYGTPPPLLCCLKPGLFAKEHDDVASAVSAISAEAEDLPRSPVLLERCVLEDDRPAPVEAGIHGGLHEAVFQKPCWLMTSWGIILPNILGIIIIQ